MSICCFYLLKIPVFTLTSPFIAQCLFYAIEKLTKRFASEEDITVEFRDAWERFFDLVVSMMFDGDNEKEDNGAETAESMEDKSPSTPPLSRRSLMRKRSETLGRMPLRRSFSADERNSPVKSPSRRKHDAPRPLFRTPSFSKKKNRLSTSVDSSHTLKGIKENWKILQPHARDIVSELFVSLQQLDTFGFVRPLLGRHCGNSTCVLFLL